MSALKDLTGQTFGLLTVIKRGPNNKFNKPQYWCKCDCGNPELVLKSGNDLKQGNVKSCGCLIHNRPKKEKIRKPSKTELQRQARIGEERYNTNGDLMRIVEYKDTNHVIIEFQDWAKHKMMVNYGNFIKGTIKNPFNKFLYNRGYLGVGDYNPSINRIATPEYEAWRKMFDRCYGKNQEEAYEGCEVCEEWYNFQNFAKWYRDHYWKDENYRMQIDKDWKIFGNKIYSPDACEIVPSIINSCLIRHGAKKYDDRIANIQYTSSGKYKPRLSQYGRRVELGTYSDINEAMKVYKSAKIKYVQEIANRYKDKISYRLYEAMMNYENRLVKELPEYAAL